MDKTHNYFLKVLLYFSFIYPITNYSMSNKEIRIREKLKMNSTYCETRANTLQELLMRAKREGITDNQPELLQNITTLAKIYSQEDDKINSECNPEYSVAVRYTALQLSAFYGFSNIFKILLAYGANPDIPWKDLQFDASTQQLKVLTHDLEGLIERRGKVSSVNSIDPEAAQSMLAALSTRKWSFFWSCKSHEERAQLLGITLTQKEPIS